jgi:hypothetical protein
VKKVLLLIIIVLSISGLFAQGSSFGNLNSNPAYFYSGSLNNSEQLNIPAYIWGQVKKPGLHIIPDDTNLLTLISLAGGPTEDAKLNKVRIVRPLAEGDKVIWVDIEQYLETGDETLIPQLMPGDTVVISGTVFYAMYKVADFLSKIVIVLSAYSAVNNL